MRKTFTMNAAQHAKLLEAMQPVAAMWIGGPPRSVQQNANDAWIALGREMGFDGMTVRSIPGGSEFEFSAEAAPVTNQPPRPAADLEYESWISALGVATCLNLSDCKEQQTCLTVGVCQRSKQPIRTLAQFLRPIGVAIPLENKNG